MKTLQNKYLQPLGSPIDNTNVQQKFIPWKWGVAQGVQLRNIRSSSGQFKNLSAGEIGSIVSITGGTISASSFKSGTINNSIFSGTISQPSVTGGTFINPVINTSTISTSIFQNGTISGGTVNNAVLGTPNITGGTVNAVLQASGTQGIGTVIKYVVSVSPGTVLGTLTFANGLLILSQ
jgi:hypothetical protein